MTIGFNALGRMGRLCNQMFQYAALKGISRNVGADIIIPYGMPNIIAIDFISTGLTKNSPISKYFFDLCVEAPQYFFESTFIPPILSNSFRYFINIILDPTSLVL